jgi:ketosteroid isomerase-like protein
MATDESRGAPLTREAMRSVIERLHRLWSTGALSLIPELYAADFVAHFPAGWEFKGHLGVREVIESARIAYPDWTETVADIIIEGDKAVSRCVSTGVHKGFFQGQAPTGERIVVDDVSIFRFEGGLVAEQWCVFARRESRPE